MADGVQYVMDRMSGLFRQLQELEIFTTDEVGAIVKRRTDFEYVMKRRQLFIEDFYGYLQYEINLDKLRVLRCQRLEKSGGGGKERQDAIRNVKSQCSRHICSIFDRATRRFPNNMDIWADYIAYLKESKSTSVLNAVFGKALSLHPKNQDFWIQAAVHELEENNNVHAARVLFQRALRSNKISQKLWLRYFELELWNSARIIERNKILGLESSSEALFGAPVVVFKHALLAVEDLDMALDMYRVADGLQDGDFTGLLHAQMREKFSGRAAFWGALAGFSDGATVLPPSQTREQDEAPESQTKKRKMDPELVEVSAMDASVQRLQRLLKLLQNGKDAVAFSNEPGQVDAFALVEALGIQKGLRGLWETLRSAHKAGKLSLSTSGGENLAPKKKGKEKRFAEDIPSPAAVSTSDSCLEVLSVVAARFAVDVPAVNGATSTGKFPAVLVATNGMKMMPLLMSASASSHLLGQVLDLLKEAFPHSAVSPALTHLSSTCRQLAELLKCSAKFLTRERALLMHATESAAWNVELEAVKHWCGTFGTCYAAAKDSKTLLRGGKSAADGVMKSIADAGSAVVSMALCLEEGSSCISKTLEALDSVGSSEEVTKYWRDVISSAQFHFASRGEWCAQYLDWCLEKKGNDTFKIVQAAHEWIESLVKSSVPATVGGDMLAYYARLLDVQVPIFKSNLAASAKGGKDAVEIIAFTRAVAEKAATECPKESTFWDTWEDLERKLGQHAVANHVRWKRDSETLQS